MKEGPSPGTIKRDCSLTALVVGTCAGAELRWNTFQHLHLNKKMSYGRPAPHQQGNTPATWKIIIINRLSAVTLPCPILCSV